jgi:hypothetical protein
LGVEISFFLRLRDYQNAEVHWLELSYGLRVAPFAVLIRQSSKKLEGSPIEVSVTIAAAGWLFFVASRH